MFKLLVQSPFQYFRIKASDWNKTHVYDCLNKNPMRDSVEKKHLLRRQKFSGMPVPTFGRDEVSSCRWHDGEAIDVRSTRDIGLPLDGEMSRASLEGAHRRRS